MKNYYNDNTDNDVISYNPSNKQSSKNKFPKNKSIESESDFLGLNNQSITKKSKAKVNKVKQEYDYNSNDSNNSNNSQHNEDEINEKINKKNKIKTEKFNSNYDILESTKKVQSKNNNKDENFNNTEKISYKNNIKVSLNKFTNNNTSNNSGLNNIDIKRSHTTHPIKSIKPKSNWGYLNNVIKDLNVKKVETQTKDDLFIYSVVFNMKGAKPEKKDMRHLLPKNKDYNVYVIGGVECMRSIFLSIFYDNKDEWVDMIREELGSEFEVIKANTLGSMHLIVLAKNTIACKFKNVQTNTIKTGMGNIVSNKGAVAIAMTYENTSILVLNCHLAAGQNKQKNRNIDFHRINKELTIPGYPIPIKKETITDKFDICIWMGDFNYRINMERDILQEYLLEKRLDYLLNHDQFYQEIVNENLDFNHFFESRINFYPTYKFCCNTDYYDFDNGKIPGWCDRIIFKSALDKQFGILKYNWIRNINFSDHKPVCAEFIFNLKEVKRDMSEEDKDKVGKIINNETKSKACIIY